MSSLTALWVTFDGFHEWKLCPGQQEWGNFMQRWAMSMTDDHSAIYRENITPLAILVLIPLTAMDVKDSLHFGFLHLKRKLSDCIVLIVQWSSCETSALLAVLAYHWVYKKQAEAQWGIHIHVQSWKAFTLKGLFGGVLAASQFYQRGLSDWKAFSFQTSPLHC